MSRVMFVIEVQARDGSWVAIEGDPEKEWAEADLASRAHHPGKRRIVEYVPRAETTMAK